jgi:hypothetical protein
VWAVGHARFTGDESYFWATARNIATFEAAPVYGPPLTGSSAFHPGPIFYYLMAIPQRIGTSPWIGGIFVVLLHALSAWLLFLLARAARGERAGLVALALLAFAPWDVLYADRIWLSCVAPVWGTLVLYAAARGVVAGWQGVLIVFALTCLRERNHYFVRGQKERRAAPARDKLHLLIPLTSIDFKREGQFAVGLIYVNLDGWTGL